MADGAYREAFDSALPGWAAAGFSALTNGFTPVTGLPARSNTWFNANVKVLHLDTDGAVVTNTLAYPGAGGAVSFEAKPLYVDMRVKFDAVTESPDPALMNNAKFAVFISSDAKLVAVHADGSTTNDFVLDTNRWYQLTIKIRGDGKYDVLTNDATVAALSGLVLKNAGVTNTLAAIGLFGMGTLDELYISHGNPAYETAGPTRAIPALPAAGDHPPTDPEQTRINAWLSGYAGITPDTTLALTQSQLSGAYLLNALGGNSTIATYLEPGFGIQSFDLITPTTLRVTFKLLTGGTAKSGPINGKIQLYGKAEAGDGWAAIGAPFSPTFAADGTVTPADFTVEASYRYFHPQIVP